MNRLLQKKPFSTQSAAQQAVLNRLDQAVLSKGAA
jgi:hypothetical protein